MRRVSKDAKKTIDRSILGMRREINDRYSTMMIATQAPYYDICSVRYHLLQTNKKCLINPFSNDEEIASSTPCGDDEVVTVTITYQDGRRTIVISTGIEKVVTLTSVGDNEYEGTEASNSYSWDAPHNLVSSRTDKMRVVRFSRGNGNNEIVRAWYSNDVILLNNERQKALYKKTSQGFILVDGTSTTHNMTILKDQIVRSLQ